MAQALTGHVFLSYSRRDEAVMRRITTFLRNKGIKVWVDNEKLVPGTPIWEDEIEKAIINAGAMIIICSPDSKASEWVRREVAYAEQYRKRIFPLLVRGNEETSITLRLITRQYIDMRATENLGLNSLSIALLDYLEEIHQEYKENKEPEKLTHAEVIEDTDQEIAQLEANYELDGEIKHKYSESKNNESNYEKSFRASKEFLLLQKTLRLISNMPNVPMTSFLEILSDDIDPDENIRAMILEYQRQLKDDFDLMHKQNLRIPPTLVFAIGLINSIFSHSVFVPFPTPVTEREKQLYDELVKKAIGKNWVIEQLVELESELTPKANREELLEIVNREWDAAFGLVIRL